MKRCPKCKEEKPATTEYFYRNSQTISGLAGHCKDCKAKHHKEYLQRPEVKARVVPKIRAWQKGVGREKYKIIRKKYDTSKKRVEWRRQRYFGVFGRRVNSLEEAINSLEQDKLERGIAL